MAACLRGRIFGGRRILAYVSLLICFLLLLPEDNALHALRAHRSSPASAAPRRLRVALLFSGQPRNVKGLAAQKMHVCVLNGRFDVDIFAHFWFEPGNGL